MTSKPALIVIRDKDNVATATRDIRAGEQLSYTNAGRQSTLTARQDVHFLHKVALRDIATGERVYKYGAVIGEATGPIAAGEHVHVHNIRSLWGRAKS